MIIPRIKTLLLLIATAVAAFAQTPDWLHLSRYAADNAQIAHVADPQRVVFMGNSITDGWDDMHPDFFAKHNVDRGIAGETSCQMLLRFHDDVINLHPKAVVILAGTNDVAENTGSYMPDYTLGNIISMCRLAQAEGISPIICSVLPAESFYWHPDVTDAHAKIEALNERLQAFATESGITFVDYRPAMTGEGNVVKEGYTIDGVHPSSIGYDAMEAVITPVINAVPARSVNVTAATFNIRLAVADDGLNYWPNRADYAANIIKFHELNIVGLQEATRPQLDDLLNRLPGYDFVGQGRDRGTKGEYSAILYNSRLYEPVDTGTFALAEDLAAIGQKGWDAACPRIASWARFRDKSTGCEFLFLNTHLDHKGKIARREGANLIVDATARLAGDLPALVTGDFNAEESDEPIQVILNSGLLRRSRSLADFVYGPERTYHDYGRLPYAEQEAIDYIFVKGNIKVSKYGVLSEHIDSLYPSDHYPVMIQATICY